MARNGCASLYTERTRKQYKTVKLMSCLHINTDLIQILIKLKIIHNSTTWLCIWERIYIGFVLLPNPFKLSPPKMFVLNIFGLIMYSCTNWPGLGWWSWWLSPLLLGRWPTAVKERHCSPQKIWWFVLLSDKHPTLYTNKTSSKSCWKIFPLYYTKLSLYTCVIIIMCTCMCMHSFIITRACVYHI